MSITPRPETIEPRPARSAKPSQEARLVGCPLRSAAPLPPPRAGPRGAVQRLSQRRREKPQRWRNADGQAVLVPRAGRGGLSTP